MLVHILEHVEHISDVLLKVEPFLPLLDLVKGAGGKVDMMGAAQLRRKFRGR